MRSQLNRQRALYALLTCVVSILVLSLIDLHSLALTLAKSTGGPIGKRTVPEFTPLSQGAIQFGSLEPARGAYIEISATFHGGAGGSPYPNLFQTGPGNSGVRLEVRGTVATLMVHDYRASDQLQIVIITRSLSESEHHLEFKALNGQFVSGRIDGDAFFVSKPVFDVSDLLLGAAFDGARPWDGSIADATICMGHVSSGTYRITMALKPICLIATLLLALLTSVVVFNVQKFVLESAKRMIADRTLFGGPWQRPAWLAPNHSANTILVLRGGLGFVVALATTALYHALYFNRYAPVTEGWFLGFAHLMDEGLVPYRDFTLMLPPLYTFSTWVLHQLIGDNLLQLRLIGVGVVILLFLILQGILSVFFARWAASFASAIAIIYYQSGVAFIGYDFTQFLTLYLLTGLWALQKYWLNRRTPARAACYLFVSGAAFSLAILTKHSNAAVVLIIMGLAFTFVVWRADPFRVALRQLVTFSLGVATPLATTAITLACFGALEPFFRNTGSDALAAKGGLNLVLSGWISSFFDQSYFVTSAALGAALILMSTLIVALAIGTDVVKSAWSAHAFWGPIPKPGTATPAKDKALAEAPWPVQAMSAAGLLLFCLLLLALRFPPRPALQPWIETGESLRALVPAASVSIYLLGTVASACILFFSRRQAAAPWFFLFIFGLALAAGNGTSSNSLSEISLFVGLAVLVAGLLTFGSSSMAGQIPTLLLAICFCLSLARDKFAMPYGWWYLKTAPVERTDCTPAPSLLNGLCFGPTELEKIDSIVAQIRAHSAEGESIYVYPHMPMFTLLSNRRPYANAVMSWYDFMVDRDASRIAADLMSSPPPVIILAKLPQAVMREHEKYFRGGKRSGQRDILEAIDALNVSGRLKKVLDVTNLDDVDVTVFSRSDR